MTVADPYPESLVDEAIVANPDAVTNRLITAVNRLAQAVEQNTLALLDNGAPKLAQLPPVRPQPAAPTAIVAEGVCPIHGAPWKTVPAGTSKRTGKPYEAFQACPTAGCDQRPPR